jgi:hypothetical protein
VTHRVRPTKRQANSRELIDKSTFNGCIGKVRHESERMARRAIEKRCSDADVQLFTYRCRHCKGWHLTKQAPRPVHMLPNADGFEYVEGV